MKRDEAVKFSVDSRLQKAIDANMPHIRIEQLLMEVDQATHFTRNFVPLQRDQSRPKNFYKTLLATIISQATNLGVVAMSESVAGMSIDMLRHVLKHYIREKTLTGANADIVNHHHQLSLSAVHGTGEETGRSAETRINTSFPAHSPILCTNFYTAEAVMGNRLRKLVLWEGLRKSERSVSGRLKQSARGCRVL